MKNIALITILFIPFIGKGQITFEPNISKSVHSVYYVSIDTIDNWKHEDWLYPDSIYYRFHEFPALVKISDLLDESRVESINQDTIWHYTKNGYVDLMMNFSLILYQRVDVWVNDTTEMSVPKKMFDIIRQSVNSTYTQSQIINWTNTNVLNE